MKIKFLIIAVLISFFTIGFNSYAVTKLKDQVKDYAEIFTFIRTILLTPDANYQTGSFARINYVPARDRFIVNFGVKNKESAGNCPGAGYAYKES